MEALVQKLHPALSSGQRLTVADSGNPLFSRQGDWDGGSPLHCVAMALALLGKLSDPVQIRQHVNGPESQFLGSGLAALPARPNAIGVGVLHLGAELRRSADHHPGQLIGNPAVLYSGIVQRLAGDSGLAQPARRPRGAGGRHRRTAAHPTLCTSRAFVARSRRVGAGASQRQCPPGAWQTQAVSGHLSSSAAGDPGRRGVD